MVSRRLLVQEPRNGVVTVYKGGEARITLSCTPYCTTPLVIGDAPTYFDAIAKEVKTKQAIGQNSAEGEKQSE